MNREELAWAAGFFDGEGCIGAYFTGVNSPKLVIRIVQINRRPLERWCAALGVGTVYGPKESQSPRGKPYYTVSVSSFEDVQAAVAMMWVFLCPIKQADAAHALGIMGAWFTYNRVMCRKRLHTLAEVGRLSGGSCAACSAQRQLFRGVRPLTAKQRRVLESSQ